MSKHEGGCLCGNIRYEITDEPVATAICHCKNCQKQTGTTFSIIAVQLGDKFNITKGELATYMDKGDSGRDVIRQFCSNCGSPIISTGEFAPGMVAIKAGTFDDTSFLDPKQEVYCDSSQSWLKLANEMKSLPKS